MELPLLIGLTITDDKNRSLSPMTNYTNMVLRSLFNRLELSGVLMTKHISHVSYPPCSDSVLDGGNGNASSRNGAQPKMRRHA